ncbi:MAG: VC0807 family protein [Candidatus Promineifilaceae bacterium]|jgi:intracellular septation protein A
MSDTTKPNLFLEPLLTLVVPALILMKLSDPERLGALPALLLALAFPLVWGIRDLIRSRKLNLFATLGLVSVGLTGGIGLLQLDNQWLAVKEAAIPGMIGLAVIVSGQTRYSLIHALLLNPKLIDVARIQQQLSMRGTTQIFETRLRTATWLLGGTFFFSAAMNYLLATWIVTSPAGSPAFNEELGRLALLSYPMIAIPSMLMMMAVLYYLVRTIRILAGITFTEAFTQPGARHQS